MNRLHVRFLRFSAFYTPLLLSLEAEALAREGLTASFDRARSGVEITDGLRDGTVQLAQSAPAVSFAPSLAGTPPGFRHFALMNRHDGFFLGARDTAREFHWRSLEGKRVLVDHFFQPLALFRTALRREGVDERRVQFIDAGDPASMEAAFRAGEGDFVHLQGPGPQQLEEEGLCRVVASVGETTPELAFSSLCAMPAWIASDAAGAFMRVYRRARAEADRLDAGVLAARVQPYLPDASREALTRTIARYQQMGTWRGETGISKRLHAQTVDVFIAAGHIDGRPRWEDVCQDCPPGQGTNDPPGHAAAGG